MSVRFLQTVIVVIGICALAFLLWEPHVEGRNVNAALFEIYFKDPFLAYAYVSSISFFVALYQTFMLLRNVGRNEAFSRHSLKALRTIKKCGALLMACVAVGIVWILLSDSDDKPPGFFMGGLIGLVALAIALAADRALKKISNSRIS